MRDWEIASIGIALYYFALVLLLSFACAALISLLFSASDFRDRSKTMRERIHTWLHQSRIALPYVFAVGLIGGLAGQLGGGSRDGVVGDVLPAVFTLLGGFIAYYLGEEKPKSRGLLRNSLSFLICFFLVYNVSAVWRQSSEAFEFCKSVYSNADFAKGDLIGQRDYLWGAYCSEVFSKWTDSGGRAQINKGPQGGNTGGVLPRSPDRQSETSMPGTAGQ